MQCVTYLGSQGFSDGPTSRPPVQGCPQLGDSRQATCLTRSGPGQPCISGSAKGCCTTCLVRSTRLVPSHRPSATSAMPRPSLAHAWVVWPWPGFPSSARPVPGGAPAPSLPADWRSSAVWRWMELPQSGPRPRPNNQPPSHPTSIWWPKVAPWPSGNIDAAWHGPLPWSGPRLTADNVGVRSNFTGCWPGSFEATRPTSHPTPTIVRPIIVIETMNSPGGVGCLYVIDNDESYSFVVSCLVKCLAPSSSSTGQGAYLACSL